MSCNCKMGYERCSNMSEQELLMQISRIQFVCVELNLYLDTHPDDEEAQHDYMSYSMELRELMEMYEMRYGPLMNFGHSDTENGSWVFSEWPWD